MTNIVKRGNGVNEGSSRRTIIESLTRWRPFIDLLPWPPVRVLEVAANSSEGDGPDCSGEGIKWVSIADSTRCCVRNLKFWP